MFTTINNRAALSEYPMNVKLLNPSLVIPIHYDDLFGDYGEVRQNPLMLEFDRSWAMLLTSLVHPAQLRQMRFAEAVAIFNEVENSIRLP